MSLLIIAGPSPALAVTGTDESFTTGYRQRTAAEAFHLKETYAEEEKVNPEAWVFHKELKLASTYDDNLLSELHDPEGDTIRSVFGSTGLSRQTGPTYLETFYDLNYVQYVESEKLNRAYHSHRLAARHQPTDRLTLTFDNSARPAASLSVGDRRELGVAESNRVTAMADSMTASATYMIGPKTSATVSYNWNLNYLPASLNTGAIANFSTQVHTINPRISYQWTPKTSFKASYAWALADYFESGTFSSITHTLSGGASYRVTAKTSANVDLSYVIREYDDSDQYETTDGFGLRLAINRRLTPKISLSLSASYDNTAENLDVENSDELMQLNEYYGLNASYLFTPFISVDAGCGMALNHRSGALTLPDLDNAGVLFTREYDTDTYDAHIGLNWHPKFGTFGLTYSSVNKNASFKDFEFEKSTIAATADFKF